MIFFIIIIIGTINVYPVIGFWLIPDYWTTIYRSGHIEPGRSNEQFITFPNSKHMYIGYWISSEKHYHEAYGSVYSDGIDDRGTQYCGTFADVYQNKSAKICGSFRILSSKRNATTNPFEFVPISDAIKNPEKPVEYLDWQIARFRTNSSEKWVIGCSNILKRIAYFPHNGGQLKKIDFKENVRTILDNNVQVLQRSAAFDPRDLYEQVPSVAQIAAATRKTTAKKLTTKTMPKTTRITMKTTSTTTETPAEHEHDYDNLAGAGIEWDANVEAKPPSDSSQKLEARISTEDLGKLKKLANIRIRGDEAHHSFYDEEIYREIGAETSDDEIHEILSDYDRNSRISITRNEEQIIEQNFKPSLNSKELEDLQDKRKKARGKNLSEPSGQNRMKQIFNSAGYHDPSEPSSSNYDQDDFSFDFGRAWLSPSANNPRVFKSEARTAPSSPITHFMPSTSNSSPITPRRSSWQGPPVYNDQQGSNSAASSAPSSPPMPKSSATSPSSSPNTKMRKTKKSLSFNKLFGRKSSGDGEKQLTEEDYGGWRRYKECELGIQNAITTIRSRLDQWDAEVKKKKQIKINARELSPDYSRSVSPTKREWDETRRRRLDTMNNTFRGTPPSSPSNEGNNKKKELDEGPYIDAAIYSPEMLEKIEKQEGKKVYVTKKYDLAAHARTVEEAKENLILYDKKIDELRKMEAKFAALTYQNNSEEQTEQQRIEIQYEKQYVSQKIVRQIYAVGGTLNILYLNVCEMVESGYTEEKKKLSKKLGTLIRRINKGDEETDESDIALLQ
ncbi:hypothetical protein niasHS_004645 [Heterodera schachtii]|uniref:Effector protein n=1 Tax=Heterodera schachtii TaxID=97005 RepID=A0ABD2K103_HETSC